LRMEGETWFNSARMVPPQSTTAAAPIPIVGARWDRSAGCAPSRAAPPVAAWTQQARAAKFRERWEMYKLLNQSARISELSSG